MKTINKLSLLLAVVVVAAAAATTPAVADTAAIELRPGQRKALDMCKGDAGHVEVKRNGPQINVVFKDASCSELDIFRAADSNRIYKTYKLRGKAMPRSASFTLPKAVLKGARSVKLRIRSNSGKHADWLHIAVATPRPELALGSTTNLSRCGGTLEITHSRNRGNHQVNVVLEDVRRCKNFTVEANNGRTIARSYPIAGGKRGRRAASFTLSWNKVIDKGRWGFKENNIDIKVSGPGGVEDEFVVAFLAAGN